MHILKIIHGYPPFYNAGSEVYSQSICNELSKKNKVTVFTREENPYAPDFTIRFQKVNDNLSLYFINMAQGKDGFRHSELDEKFGNLLVELRPDIAHIGHLNHLSTGIVDQLNLKNIPIVFTLHDFWLMCPRGQFLQRNSDGKNLWQLCDKQDNHKCASTCYKPYFSGYEIARANNLTYEFNNKAWKRKNDLNDLDFWTDWVGTRMDETKTIIDKVALFIAPSQYLRKRFVEEFAVPEDKIIYLDYGFPTEYLTQTEKSKNKHHFTFGYIGTHIPSKGLNILIDAFKQIKGAAKLKIYGRQNGQSTNALKQMASGSINEIEFAGEYINHNLANDVFSQVDCIVVPSIWGENSPLVIHEAQACKIPVITADFGGMKEYVQHEVNGLLFEHRNSISLLEQLQRAADNPMFMLDLGRRGYLFSDDGSVTSIKDHCNKLLTIYDRFIRQKKLWRITIDTNPEDCNLKCIMCEEHSPYSKYIPTLLREKGIKHRRMNVGILENIFRQARESGIQEIIPSTMGEPLLYKHIDLIYHFAQKHLIKINLTTNGTFPGRSMAEWSEMIIPNTSDIKISWNGSNPTTAEKIMNGLNYQKALENIKYLINHRDKYYRMTGNYCRITFQLTFLQNTVNELVDIVKLAAELGVDRVKGHHLWTHFDEIRGLSMKRNKESIAEWNNLLIQVIQACETFRKPNGERVILDNFLPLAESENSTVPIEYECPFLEKELWISATGQFSVCCAPDNLRKTLGDFGNISSVTIKEVFNSHIYQELCKNYKTKTLCSSCIMRKPA